MQPDVLFPASSPAAPLNATCFGAANSPAGVSSPLAGGFSSAQAFVDTWVSAPHRPEPVARDYSFKAVIGEPSW